MPRSHADVASTRRARWMAFAAVAVAVVMLDGGSLAGRSSAGAATVERPTTTIGPRGTIATVSRPATVTSRDAGTPRTTVRKPTAKRVTPTTRRALGSTARRTTATIRRRSASARVTRRNATRAAATTLPPTAPPAPSTIVATLAPQTTSATTTTAPATSAPTTSAVTTTTAPTTTTSVGNEFEVIVPTPTQTIAAGATASFVVLVSPRSTTNPLVTFVVSNLPDGALATISPNPSTNAAELRVTVPTTLVPGTYAVRVVGNSGTTSRSATVNIVVTAATSSTTPAASTTTPLVAGQYALTVTADGKKLATGSAVSFAISVLPGTGFTGQVGLAVAGVPPLVSAAFTTNPTSASSTLWLSTTLVPAPGTYTLQLTASAIPNGLVITLPLTLVIV